MLNHKFTAREAGVILLLTAVIIGYVYYYVVYQYFENEVKRFDVTEVEDEIELERAKAIHLQQMKEELENEESSDAVLGIYNNQSAELLALADILEGKATGISLDWGDPVLDGTIVRRDVSISFTTGSFEEAGNIIKEIADCEYSLLVVDMSMSEIKEYATVPAESQETAPAETEAVDAEAAEPAEPAETAADDAAADTSEGQTEANSETVIVNKITTVTMTIRFFETTEGAENLNGLVEEEVPVETDSYDDGLPSTEDLNEELNDY